MNEKTILVTGATDGIGKAIVMSLAGMGQHVLLHGRNPGRGSAVIQEILSRYPHARVDYFNADLSRPATARQLAHQVMERFSRVDVLINNAGVFMNDSVLTPDGLEMTFAVNHLAVQALSMELLHALQVAAAEGGEARIVTVASKAHFRGRLEWDNLQGEKNFDPYGAYALSKLGNVLFTFELASRLDGSGITVNCLHPGGITTKLLQAGFGRGGADPAVGADTPVYLAMDEQLAGVTGRYFVDRQPADPNPIVFDLNVRQHFWQVSEKLISSNQRD